jgi:cytoskeletal protein RodZ
MSEFSERLKQARIAKGLSLHDIAATTKISIVVLESLERGDVSRVPGGIFSRSFVRAYAIEVGLDPDKTVSDFMADRERQEYAAARAVNVPEVTADDRAFLERQRKAALVVRIVAIGLVIAIVVLLLWKFRIL